jgi:hypothetical protein
MKIVVLIILFFTTVLKVNAQEEKIEEEWVLEDSIFISTYIKALKKHPLNVEAYLGPDKKRKDNLGFGYSSIEGSMGRGYVSVFYQLIYFNDKLVSYNLNPEMPSDMRLTKRYKNFYSSLYRFDTRDNPYPLYHNFREMTKPLPGYHLVPSSRALAFLMTPFSGVMYGHRGGESSSIIENRAAFNQVKERLSPQEFFLLLYSKNPATRLTAAEYYYQNPQKLAVYKGEIESRIKSIYIELPETKTISGCIVSTENSQTRVNFYVKQGIKYSK